MKAHFEHEDEMIVTVEPASRVCIERGEYIDIPDEIYKKFEKAQEELWRLQGEMAGWEEKQRNLYWKRQIEKGGK